MGIIHGLTVMLIIGGITIQCDVHQNRISRTKLQDLPLDLIEIIFNNTNFRTVGNANRLVLIERPRVRIHADGNHHAFRQQRDANGELVFAFGSYSRLHSFFQRHGHEIRKVELVYDEETSDSSDLIQQNVIKPYAHHFIELGIQTYSLDRGFLSETDDDNEIIFPNVQIFKYDAHCRRREFKLNRIFPKLKSFSLDGSIFDTNCLADVTGLEELLLRTTSISENQLNSIFENNKGMTRLALYRPMEPVTMNLIAENLMKLKSLEVEEPGKGFLFRAESQEAVHILPSVMQLIINVNQMAGIIGDPSFEMPNLEKLVLHVMNISDRSDLEAFEKIHSIGYFVKLQTVEFNIYAGATPERVGKIKEIFLERGWTILQELRKPNGIQILAFQRRL